MEVKDFLIVGNYSHDRFLYSGKKFLRLGGPPAYLSRLFDALKANYDLVSKVGKDFKYMSEISHKPIVTTTATTLMEHEFKEGRKVASRMLRSCEQILPEDITIKARIAIIGSHAMEVPPETIKFLRKHCKIILADAQGMIRVADENRNISLTYLKKTPYWKIMKLIDFFKVSEEESEFVNMKRLRKETTLLITLSEKGCRILGQGKDFDVPTKPLKGRGRTGAGDFFLGGFSWALFKGLPLRACAEMANYCGGLALNSLGVPEVTHKMVKKIL